MVTLLAGAILVAGTASALIGASRREGPALWIVAATCAALTVIVGIPNLVGAIRDPAGNVIQFGEYLTIPGLLGTLILLLLMTVPFAVAPFGRPALRCVPARLGVRHIAALWPSPWRVSAYGRPACW